jgi:hypothetical protein
MATPGIPSPRTENGTSRATERAQIGEAAARRHTAPIASMALWAALCGSIVIALHALSIELPARLGSYRTGLLTLAAFVLSAVYPVRKYTMGLSLRWMRLATHLPRPLAVRMLLLDRLETWRATHIALGVMAMLPFWWHTGFGRRSLLELVLEGLVILLVLSGFLGAGLEDFLPVQMLKLGNKEVRLEDVEAAFHQLYVEAEELVLGHSEALVHAYLLSVRPILIGSQSLRTMLCATLAGSDPAPAAGKPVRALADGLGSDSTVLHELVDIAERKVRLEHNQFNLRLGAGWLLVHRRLAIAVLVLIVFHVAGVLYFAGL